MTRGGRIEVDVSERVPDEPGLGDRGLFAIIPAYNEAVTLPRVLRRFKRRHPTVPVVVIDDGSTDETAQAALRSGAIVIRHPFNLGYGAALQTGYRYALSRGARGVVQLDADGQHPPEEVHRLIAALNEGGADVILGSRFSGRGDYRSGPLRYLGILLFRLLVRWTTGLSIRDPTSGFQALSRRCLEHYQNDFPEDYPDAEVLIRMHLQGYVIREVPVRMMAAHRPGRLHRGLQPFFYLYKNLLAIALLMARARKEASP